MAMVGMVKGEVKVVSVTLLNPDPPSLLSPSPSPSPSAMQLPAIDAMWHEFHYNRRILFYRVDPGCFPSALTLLKTSLRQTLAYFYPWTGRLARSANGRFSIEFPQGDDSSSSSGVEFIEATTDVSYKELLGNGFQLHPFFDKLCKWNRNDHSQIYDMPLLSIQVTEFRDGGMALGYAHSHVVADGSAMWNFMKSWSECARGMAISLPPTHQRDRFMILNPRPELGWNPSNNLLLNKEDQEEEALSDTKDPPLSQHCFLFTKQMTNHLKTLAIEGSTTTSTPFTTYEVLCAHFWKRVTQARALPPSSYVHFGVLANCRSRVQPPLPPSYFGNCVGFYNVQTAAGEILAESLAATALRIRHGVKQSTNIDTVLLGFSHWLELHNFSIMSQPFPNNGMLVASSPHFPCYEVNFGPTTGSPESVRTALIKGDGEMVVFPNRHNIGDIDICVALKPQVMDRLLSDPYFLNI